MVLATLLAYLWVPVVFGLTALPLIAVLPSSPPILDGTARPSPWRISLTVTIARSSPKEQP
ncbi:MAG TPA: hypothetical protein VFN11_20765 [Ktedonobacterales bacterium]|nr:hypothetical protein [Ktedonobacterales bacterium]